jgi:hypothetical protein
MTARALPGDAQSDEYARLRPLVAAATLQGLESEGLRLDIRGTFDLAHSLVRQQTTCKRHRSSHGGAGQRASSAEPCARLGGWRIEASRACARACVCACVCACVRARACIHRCGGGWWWWGVVGGGGSVCEGKGDIRRCPPRSTCAFTDVHSNCDSVSGALDERVAIETSDCTPSEQ